MITRLRQAWAWRAALRRVRRRTPRAWHPDPRLRRVLFVVPEATDLARPAWQLIERWELDPARTLAVLAGADIGAVPPAYLHSLRLMGEREIGRLGLPNREFLREAWGFDPDVAVDFAGPEDLAAALLVGGSPAAFRIGPAGEGPTGAGLEPFFDLLVGPHDDPGAAVHALEAALSRIAPPVLARLEEGGGAGEGTNGP